MPKDFLDCVERGGKVVTKDLGDGKYVHLCHIDGKWHEGEVKTKEKATAMKLTKAQAAVEFKNFSVNSDGTKDGTVIKVNGEAIENLASCYIMFFNDSYSDGVSFEFSTKDPEPKPGTLVQTTYFRLCCPCEASQGRPAQAGAIQQGVADETKHYRPSGLRELYRTM